MPHEQFNVPTTLADAIETQRKLLVGTKGGNERLLMISDRALAMKKFITTEIAPKLYTENPALVEEILFSLPEWRALVNTIGAVTPEVDTEYTHVRDKIKEYLTVEIRVLLQEIEASQDDY